MKTLSFHDLQVGRKAVRPLLDLDTARQGVRLEPGLQLIVAPNGYGKSTFLQTIGGVLAPLKGHAKLDDKRLDAERDVLYVSEYLNFPKFIYPPEWVDFMAGGRKLQGQEKWIQGFRLQGLMKSYLGRMSQGERRKVTWLGANASKKPVLLLDEPLDGLDLLAIDCARDMLRTWKAEGRIVLIVAHQVGEVLDLADRIFLVRGTDLITWDQVDSRPAHTMSPDEFRAKVLQFYTEQQVAT